MTRNQIDKACGTGSGPANKAGGQVPQSPGRAAGLSHAFSADDFAQVGGKFAPPFLATAPALGPDPPVDDVLDGTDVAPRRHWGFGGAISAGTWGNPKADIPNFPRVDTPQAGDIVGMKHWSPDASGHVAIVIVPGVSSIGAGEKMSRMTGWPWDKKYSPQGGEVVYRRCTCP